MMELYQFWDIVIKAAAVIIAGAVTIASGIYIAYYNAKKEKRHNLSTIRIPVYQELLSVIHALQRSNLDLSGSIMEPLPPRLSFFKRRKVIKENKAVDLIGVNAIEQIQLNINKLQGLYLQIQALGDKAVAKQILKVESSLEEIFVRFAKSEQGLVPGRDKQLIISSFKKELYALSQLIRQDLDVDYLYSRKARKRQKSSLSIYETKMDELTSALRKHSEPERFSDVDKEILLNGGFLPVNEKSFPKQDYEEQGLNHFGDKLFMTWVPSPYGEGRLTVSSSTTYSID